MDEKREFDFEPEGLIEEAEPAPYAEQWFSDDYEKHFQETDSTPKSMTVYTPKQKKKKGFFRNLTPKFNRSKVFYNHALRNEHLLN